MTTTKSRSGRIIERVTAIWSEIDYAQRRMFEIRAGLYEPRGTHTTDTDAGRRPHDERAAEGLQC
jgi:hypothetical protein